MTLRAGDLARTLTDTIGFDSPNRRHVSLPAGTRVRLVFFYKNFEFWKCVVPDTGLIVGLPVGHLQPEVEEMNLEET